MARKSSIERKTTETEISVELNLDGSGKAAVSTSVPFVDHMLTLFAKHGFFDLELQGKGDTDVDYHHLVEDIGICLGRAIKEALGDKKGIRRYGSASVPMDESLCRVDLDLSGRPFLVFNVSFGRRKILDFDPGIFSDFFKALSDTSGMTLHINLPYGKNNHHKAEAIFKAFGRALSDAVSRDARIKGVLSTKGSL